MYMDTFVMKKIDKLSGSWYECKLYLGSEYWGKKCNGASYLAESFNQPLLKPAKFKVTSTTSFISYSLL